jgi:adenylate cyclase
MDFEAEGLLDGLEGEEREARKKLLEQLSEDGVSDTELKKAVEEQRLALVPVERALGSNRTMSAEEAAEKAGVSVEFVGRHRRALGLPQPEEGSRAYSEEDVDALKDVKSFIDAGLDEEGIEDTTRVVGESMSRVARSVAELTASSLLRPGVTEHDLGVGFAEAARHLVPLFGKQLEFVFKQQLLELVRSEMVSHTEREAGRLPGSETVNVSFADLVGFTKMGEELPPEEIGRVAGKLGELAADLAEPPVRLVKTIGDAAMLVAPEGEAAALVRVTLDLVQAAEQQGEDFPMLRAGVARGEAIGRGGDWYGRPVNVASRLTGVARPGSVLATESVYDEAEDAFTWSFAGKKKLKGVKEPLPLFRAREKSGGNGADGDGD